MGVLILNIAFILEIISYVFFKLPLIISIIFIFMFVIACVREKDFQLNKLVSGGIGILSVIIVSIVFKFLPQVLFIDKLGSWICKVMCTMLILFAISDTYEGKTNGIKALGIVSFMIILFNVIKKIAN